MDQAIGAYFFGYGSLVNRDTHTYAPAAAEVIGWRRAWRHTPLRSLSFLTVRPSPGTVLQGVIAAVLGGDWQALDAREFAYERVGLGAGIRHDVAAAQEVAIYAIPEGRHQAPTPESPILLSYLDVVIQGYFREFGAAGVADFFATTDGWEAPILNDRAAPQYQRHQRLTGEEHELVDHWLGEIRAGRLG